MEEALEILWTYARREPLDSNGEMVVPTINNSIAAIRIIMRLEGWAMGSEKRKMNSEKRATHDLPASKRRGKVRESGVCEQFAQTKFAQPDTDNYDKYDDEYTDGELPFAPTPAQHQYTQPNISHNNYACLVAPSPSERGLGERNSTAGASLQLVPQENLLSFTRHTLPSFAPAPFHLAYYEVLTRFAMGEITSVALFF